jgi:hypothetical protein
MKETTYKDRIIKAASYQVGEGVWIPRVEVLANLPGAKNSHAVNGMTAFATQEAADMAAIEMGQSWTDAHNRPAAKRPRSMSGFGQHHLNGKSGVKRMAGAASKADATNGSGKADGPPMKDAANGKPNAKSSHDDGK